MTDTKTAIDFKAYDYTVLIDTSGSMLTTMPSGKTRFEESKEFTISLVHYLDEYDSDGISVGYFGNGNAGLEENVGKSKVAQILSEMRPMGSTPLHKALELALKPQAGGKPEVIFIITDGEPDDRGAVERLLIKAADSIEKDEDLAISFIQIGNDQSASSFLAHLDDNLKAKFDIVDTKNFENITSPEQAIEAALND